MEPGLLVFSSYSVQLVLLNIDIMWSKAYDVQGLKKGTYRCNYNAFAKLLRELN